MLRVVAQRKKGRDAVVVGLPIGPSRVAAVMDTGPGIVSGLELLDGSPLRNLTNESRRVNVKGVIPPIGKHCTIVCTVLTSGVLITCSGETVADCPGGLSRFDVLDYWAIPDRQAFFLGSMNGIVAFETS